MNKAQLKSFEKPDEVREFLQGRVELINVGGATCRCFRRGTTHGSSVTSPPSSATSRG